MPLNYDDLPADVQLHVFSFLSMKDTANVFKTSCALANLSNDNDFWRYKVRQDFHFSSPRDYDAKLYYQEIFVRLGQEQKVFVAFLRALLSISAYSNKIGHDAGEDERFTVNIDVEKLYESFKYQHVPQFLALANELANKYVNLGELCDYEASAKACYESLVAAEPAQIATNMTKAMLSPVFKSIHKVRLPELTPDVINVVGLHTLISSGAHMSLRVMLSKLNAELREQLLQQGGASLLCSAVVSGELECVQVLLDFGVDVNALGYLRTIAGKDIYKTPLSVAIATLRNQAIYSASNNQLGAMENIINLLLFRGADPDLPGCSEENDDKRWVQGYSALTECITVQFWINHLDPQARLETTSIQRSVVNEILKQVRAASRIEQAWVLQQQNRPQLI